MKRIGAVMKKSGGVWRVRVATSDGVRTAEHKNLRVALSIATAETRG